jgi:hypothetical protein
MVRAEESVPTAYLELIKKFEPYAETLWHDAKYPNSPTDAGYWGDGRSEGNGGIRGTCGIAVGYAVLVRAFPKDAKNKHRLERIRQALNYAANAHASGRNGFVCVDKKKWGVTAAQAQSWPTGHDSQSSLWASSLGLACMLVETQLPPTTVAACKHTVAEEASFRAGIPPASGYQLDTKAEENAWNANIVALAAGWMSKHANGPAWLKSAKQYLVNSYSTADTSNDPLASWVTTVTVFPSFAIENHGFYHPTYQLDPAASMGDSLLMAQIGDATVGTELAPFAEHNVLNVWKHLSNVVLDSGELGYPSGLDWSLHNYEHNTYFAFLATHFNDPLGRWTEARMAQLARYRQKINGDGRFIGDSLPDGFYHEALLVRHAAISWLHHQYGKFKKGPMTPPEPAFAHSPDIKLITQRNASGFFSISYGSRVMGLIVPPLGSFPEDVFITTPRFPGLIGLGALGTPQKADLVSLQTNRSGFDARLELSYKSGGSLSLFVKNVEGAIAIIEVPQAPRNAKETKAGSFSIGIENHTLTGGSREIVWSGGKEKVRERSGTKLNLGSEWACVADRLGVTAGPSGHLRYTAASSYNRRGAAEDTLEFIPDSATAPRYSVWFPGKTAREAQSLSKKVHWKAGGPEFTLQFPDGHGKLEELRGHLGG